jgi:hypothetical protein
MPSNRLSIPGIYGVIVPFGTLHSLRPRTHEAHAAPGSIVSAGEVSGEPDGDAVEGDAR